MVESHGNFGRFRSQCLRFFDYLSACVLPILNVWRSGDYMLTPFFLDYR